MPALVTFISGTLVCDQGCDVVSLQLLPSVESGEFHDEEDLHDLPSLLLHHLDDGLGGSAGRYEVIHDDDLLSGLDGVLVHLEGCGSVLQVVALGDGLPREFSLLADEDESLSALVCDGCSENESPGFGSDDEVEIQVLDGIEELVDGQFQSLSAVDDGRDVPEHYPGLREVGDGCDEIFQIAHAIPNHFIVLYPVPSAGHHIPEMMELYNLGTGRSDGKIRSLPIDPRRG